MSKRIKTISEENFSAAIDYACTLNKRMNTNVRAQKIVFPLGTIVFTLHAIMLFLGAMYALVQNNPERVIAFNNFKWITSYWNGIWGICNSLSNLVYVQVILMILYLFIIPFLISSIAVIIISCRTTAKNLVIKGNTAQKAKQLFHYLDECPRTYFEAFDGKPVYWRRASGIISGIIIILFTLYFYGSIINQNNDFLSAFSVLFQSDKYSNEIIISIVFGVIFYFLYAFLHYAFTKITEPYFDSYNKWKKFIDEAERYWLSVDKNERDERELKKLKEQEAKRKNSTKSYSSSSSSSPGLSYDFKINYINSHFGGVYSFSAIEYIESDPSLSAYEKEEMKIFLRAFGD